MATFKKVKASPLLKSLWLMTFQGQKPGGNNPIVLSRCPAAGEQKSRMATPLIGNPTSFFPEIPIAQILPSRRTISKAWEIACSPPEVSITMSTPSPFVLSRTRGRGSSLSTLMMKSASSSFAFSNRIDSAELLYPYHFPPAALVWRKIRQGPGPRIKTDSPACRPQRSKMAVTQAAVVQSLLPLEDVVREMVKKAADGHAIWWLRPDTVSSFCSQT
jgi:hypothetical protein